MPAKNQEAFFSGFELGVKEILGEKKTKEVLTVEQIVNGSPTSSLKSLKTLKDRNVKIIVGFPTSHEAVQVAKTTFQDGFLTIFASAGHSSLSEFGPTVFTTGESMKAYVADTSNLIQNRFKDQNGIFIYNLQSLFSMNQKNEFEKYFLESKENKISVDFVSLNADLKLDPAHVVQLKKGKYQYMFLSSYADESAGILNQLDTEKIDIPIISNSSWTTGDIELIRRIISEKKAPIITSAVWVPGGLTP